MAKTAYIATIQIVFQDKNKKLNNESEACDWVSGLLSENTDIIDWSYLKMHGQFLYPTEKIISNDYREGDAFL